MPVCCRPVLCEIQDGDSPIPDGADIYTFKMAASEIPGWAEPSAKTASLKSRNFRVFSS